MSETELLNLFDYERLAADRLPQLAYDYFASGAHDELTLRANREAFERTRCR
ncbi:MAG: alpha-hydroxy-acid oxidizing protein [Dehalococcoidia bacterium]